MADPANKERMQQAAAQCRAVAHLAKALVQINEDYDRMLSDGNLGALVEIIGARTARHMEALGDMLNGMDAAQPEDAWLDPVFRKARELWPQENANG